MMARHKKSVATCPAAPNGGHHFFFKKASFEFFGTEQQCGILAM
jgi:hypothetical protein